MVGAGVRRRLAKGAAEVFVHHGADVALEIGEQDAAGAQVLCAWRQLLVLLFDGRGPQGAEPASVTTLLGVLHLGIQSQFLKIKRTRKINECGFLTNLDELCLTQDIFTYAELQKSHKK